MKQFVKKGLLLLLILFCLNHTLCGVASIKFSNCSFSLNVLVKFYKCLELGVGLGSNVNLKLPMAKIDSLFPLNFWFLIWLHLGNFLENKLKNKIFNLGVFTINLVFLLGLNNGDDHGLFFLWVEFLGLFLALHFLI